MNLTRTCLSLAVIAASSLPSFAEAEQSPAVPGPSASVAPPAAAAPTPPAATDDEKTKPLREQTIYVPYSKLRAVFEREGRGVFLPYEKFQELWQQARSRHEPLIQPSPPAPMLIVDIENEATVEKDVVVVQAVIQLEVLKKGWHEIPLRLSDAAIRSAKIGSEPARIVFDPQSGHKLLVKSDSDQAARMTLAIEYVKAFTKTPGQNSVSFQAPQAPLNRWRIRIPQSGVKVNVHPLIAATEVSRAAPAPAPAAKPPADSVPPAREGTTPPAKPSEPAKPSAAAPEETVIMAFLGVAPEVRIDWTPKAEGAAGLEALASVQAEQEVTIEEGAVRTRARLVYEISRSELTQLTLELPAEQKVTGVFDANVRQWEVKTEGSTQTIRAQLFEPARGTQNLTVELERFVDVVTVRELPIPTIRALGVSRQQGIVVVRVGEELQVQPVRRNKLLQVDAAELPAALKRSTWAFAYRYAAVPFELVLSVEKAQPQIQTEELVEAYIEPERLTYDLLVLFNVQRAGVFQLEFRLPDGFEMRQVRGQAAAGAQAAAVDNFHVDDADKTRLRVNLARKATGKIGLLLELQKPLNDPNLLSPTGQSSDLPFAVPRVLTRVEHTSGRLIVYAPESLRVNPGKQNGVRSISFQEALQGVESMRQGRFGNLRETLAMAYTQAPVELSMTIDRRRPFITARQLLTARIESGTIKYDATFLFDVQYSAVKSLRIDVPQDRAAEIRNLTPAFREAAMTPQPEDRATGTVAWSFTGETELLGSTTIRLAWEQKSSELKVGESADYLLPVLRPMPVDRTSEHNAWGQVVVAKAENLDVLPKAGFTGLRPIDPQRDLIGNTRVPDAAQAFEFHGEWSLAMTATRYELEDVKRTSIERAAVRMVVTRDNEISVQALYRVRSAVQRLAVRLPEKVPMAYVEAFLNGRPVGLERGEKQSLFVPLVGQRPDQAFLLELRYSSEGTHARLDLPAFPDQEPVQSKPAVQKVFLCAYLPDELALLAYKGPWMAEGTRRFEAQFLATSEQRKDDAVIDWVSEGIPLPSRPSTSFATDGTLHVFTAIQPKDPPAGSLRLTAIPERWLNIAVFGGLALMGLFFLRASALVKLCVMTLIVVAVVLTGVFAPTFAVRVLDIRLFEAIGLVALVWLVAMAVPRRSAPTAPAPTVATVVEESPFEDMRTSYLAPTPLEPPPESAEESQGDKKSDGGEDKGGQDD